VSGRADREYARETVDRLVPVLREKGYRFGVICPQPAAAPQ
jgi:hypothetical protein